MATLTLRNVPEELYQCLKEKALAHRRSLNQEAIEWLANAKPLERPNADERIRSIVEFQRSLGKRYSVTDDEIDRWKREGRM